MDIYTIANQMKQEHKTIHDLSIRVTFYARVSTTREEQENSIEHQIQYFKEKIKNNPNWVYVPGYVDRVRGENAANRAEFMRMIEDGKNGVFDLILTKEVSRFARNTIDSLTYTRELLRSGVGVFFQNDGICTIDTDSELRLTIMSSIAADEVRKLSERVHWGHKRSIENGRVLGNNRIFGYDKIDCRLVINEQEAAMVRMIFETYATGLYSVRKIEDMLYKEGYRGRNGTRIHHNTVSGIIQNPKYKGYYCGNKVRVVDYRTKEQKFLPEDEWIMYKDESGEVVPAIVSEELWQKCNDIFRERSETVKSHERSFKDKSVFTGKIWCQAHEKPYWRTSFSNSASLGKPVYQWICSEKKRFGAKHCASIAIMEWELYSLLSELFTSVIPDIEDYVDTFLRIYKETDGTSEFQKQLGNLKLQLDRTNLKKEKLLELYMDEVLSKTEFKSRNDSISKEIESIEDDIRQIKEQQSARGDYAKSVKKIEYYLKEMYTPDNKMTKEQVDELAHTIIDRIDVIPINATEMKLIIKLKTGQTAPMTYVRNGKRYGRRSGNISKVKSGAIRSKAKVTGAIDRHKYKQPFEVHKKAFQEYLDFCTSKQLPLNTEEEQFSGYIDETEDLLYPEQALDRQLQRVNDAYDEMYAITNSSGEQLLSVRNASAETIDRVTAFINSIAKHPKEFDKEISEIFINRENFKKALEYGKEEQKKLKQSAVGAGSGIAAGTAVASMASTAAMWVATTFGTASTGTAISALSGAAATNAALAWLGGGALTAGGGGMAAGQALLALAGPVGWGIAGASVLTSVLLFWRKKKKIQESKKQEIERMLNCTNALRQLKVQMDALTIETNELNQNLSTQLGNNEVLYAQDYSTFTDDQKSMLGAIVNNTKSLAVLISKVLS